MDEKKNMTLMKQNKAFLNRETYKHMLQRMKYDQVAHKIKIQILEKLLKKCQKTLKERKKEFFRKNNEKIESEKILDELMLKVEASHKDRELRLT